jgi:succinate-semialdehyde dehydrogenase/glutarate-semialdehyde dehydrogenase
MISGLKDQSLFRQQCYIDGDWVGADSGEVVEVNNPATQEVIGTIPKLVADETRRAVEAADAAWPAWRAKTAKERSAVLRRWYELMLENQEDLARIMTTEQGKPLAEAMGEVVYAASFLEWFAEEAKRVYGDVIPGHQADKRIVVLKQPVGVVAAITPWNFPAAMITRKCAPALAVGCPVVAKPATQTPYSALALAVLAERAGVPKGVFNVVTGSASAIGGELTSNPTVRKLSFTGSTEIGKLLMKQCAGTVKKVSMELGGNAPFMVFDDADIDAAVEGAMMSKFRNTGQTCVCANRILVQDGVYDQFADKLATAVAGLKVGNGLEEGTSQGPLIDMNALSKVEEHVADAQAKGAAVIAGGARHDLGGTFYQPTGFMATMRAWPWPTIPSSVWPAISMPAPCAASGGWRRRWSRGSSASTQASSRPRWRPSAASRNRVSVAKAPNTVSTTSSRSSTSASVGSERVLAKTV